ncbi:MAG: hypothetical protein BMS9Abin06_0630 [Gammaproteobacteria bacterium]|nr:MAG: hypothetical protein BMS9Abin06_0630 [Gammaproteobacteria bacterium]
MRKIVYYILTGLFVILPLSAKAISVYPSDITISPTPQTTNDFISAQVDGSFATPGYTLSSTSLLNTTANDFEIGFSILAPDGFIIQILDPFSYSVGLGLLDAGNYSITANFYINGILDNTINNTFTVSSVPLPAAVFLFPGGVFSLFTLGRISRKA